MGSIFVFSLLNCYKSAVSFDKTQKYKIYYCPSQILLFFVSFPGFCPDTGKAKCSVKKQEDGKNVFYLLWKMLKPWTDKHIYPQNEI